MVSSYLLLMVRANRWELNTLFNQFTCFYRRREAKLLPPVWAVCLSCIVWLLFFWMLFWLEFWWALYSCSQNQEGVCWVCLPTVFFRPSTISELYLTKTCCGVFTSGLMINLSPLFRLCSDLILNITFLFKILFFLISWANIRGLGAFWWQFFHFRNSETSPVCSKRIITQPMKCWWAKWSELYLPCGGAH